MTDTVSNRPYVNGKPFEPPRPLVIGPKLRKEMLREARRLWRVWRITVSVSRRQEIARQLAAINLLLGEDLEPTIGRTHDE